VTAKIIYIEKYLQAKKLEGECGIINMDRSDSEKRCDCCYRPVSQLQPFSKADDPQFENFDGALLISVRRRVIKPDYQLERLWNEHFGSLRDEDFDYAMKVFIDLYGEKAYEDLDAYMSESDMLTWDSICRDCLALDADEYYEKRETSYMEWKKNRMNEPRDGVMRFDAGIHNDFYEEVPVGKIIGEDDDLD